MPRPIEVLNATIGRTKQGQIDGLNALDEILTNELALSENCCVTIALPVSHPTTIKTLAALKISRAGRATWEEIKNGLLSHAGSG